MADDIANCYSYARFCSLGRLPPRTPARPDAQVPTDRKLGACVHGRIDAFYFYANGSDDDPAFGQEAAEGLDEVVLAHRVLLDRPGADLGAHLLGRPFAGRGLGHLAHQDGQIRRGTSRIAGRRGASDIETPQHRAHPRQQFAQIERLRQVIVGAELQPDDPVDVVAAMPGTNEAALAMATAQAPRRGSP